MDLPKSSILVEVERCEVGVFKRSYQSANKSYLSNADDFVPLQTTDHEEDDFCTNSSHNDVIHFTNCMPCGVPVSPLDVIHNLLAGPTTHDSMRILVNILWDNPSFADHININHNSRDSSPASVLVFFIRLQRNRLVPYNLVVPTFTDSYGLWWSFFNLALYCYSSLQTVGVMIRQLYMDFSTRFKAELVRTTIDWMSSGGLEKRMTILDLNSKCEEGSLIEIVQKVMKNERLGGCKRNKAGQHQTSQFK